MNPGSEVQRVHTCLCEEISCKRVNGASLLVVINNRGSHYASSNYTGVARALAACHVRNVSVISSCGRDGTLSVSVQRKFLVLPFHNALG